MDLGKILASSIWRMVSWFVLNVSDKNIARFFAGLRWLAWVITGDRQMRMVLGEVVEIFEDGRPDTDIVRKMFREADADFASDVIRGAIRI